MFGLELDGSALDEAVAAAIKEPPGKRYSSEWQHAGPLSDRFQIDLRHHDDGTVDAFMRIDYHRKAGATGKDGAQATMRALVKCLAIP